MRAFAIEIRPSDRTFLDDQLLDPDRLAGLASDPTAAPVVAKRGRPKAGSDAAEDALYGRYHMMIGDKSALVDAF